MKTLMTSLIAIIVATASHAQMMCSVPVVDGSGSIVRSSNGMAVVSGAMKECEPTLIVVKVSYLDTYEPYDYEALDYESKRFLERATETIFFDLDEAKLQNEAKDMLKEVATAMNKADNYNLLIKGHADQSGTKEYNYDLAKERADNVFMYLIECGVSADRLNVKSYGEKKPISPNPDYNRRVEFIITK